MPMFIFAMLFNFVLATVRALGRTKRKTKTEPLCASCLHAHMQYGTNARRAISCVYAGTLRPIKLDVLYCTDYQARNLPVRHRVIGFVHQIAPAE